MSRRPFAPRVEYRHSDPPSPVQETLQYGTQTHGTGLSYDRQRRLQAYDPADHNDYDDYDDHMQNSSPSPAERHALLTNRHRFTPPDRQDAYMLQDDITQYDDEQYGDAPAPHLSWREYQHETESLRSAGSRGSRPMHLASAPPADQSGRYFYQEEIRPAEQSYHMAPRPGPHSSTRPSGNQHPVHIDGGEQNRGANPRNVHGIRLRPVSELSDMYRGIFKFGVFNAVQSQCFDGVMSSNENLIISAPTGSGKTVLFELSIIDMITQASDQVKCVYMAPTKALCSERFRDWSAKFDPIGVKCCELTGDTVQFGKSVWGDAKHANIIITTGEKWDSLTRSWRDHDRILSQIKLFLVDEVHILNENRGSTLEVVISRMKMRGNRVRFVMVSATVPNIDDIAAWVGSATGGGAPARVYQFGEEFRPCKLKRYVYGVQRGKGQNDFAFMKNLDYRLFSVLQQHSVNKPMLIFVSTRKGVISTAEHIIKEYEAAQEKNQALPWVQPRRIEQSFHDKRLEQFATRGIGVHHAGLNMDDRRATEELYLKGVLRAVVCTSTLAVGVNLPAHTVVIKGVNTFQNNVSQEYSDLEIVQMIGRAGRPQFDTEGVAIILCEMELEQKYKNTTQGKTILESWLHHNLSEHINSEIGLGTITDVRSAREWMSNSFLSQRIQKNPRHYAIGKGENQTWEERIDEMVLNSVTKLEKSQMVIFSSGSDGQLTSTEYGDIMSKFYIRQSTMSSILKLPDRVGLREILETVSLAEEFTDIKLRAGEKQVYNKIREHMDIRFKIKKIDKPSDKIFILIQAVLGGISLNAPEYKSGESQPALDSLLVFRHVSRVARVLVEVAMVKENGSHLKHGLELARCLAAKAWEDRPVILRQIEQIGEKSIKVLAEHGITSFEVLRKQGPDHIESLLNRRSPFGMDVLASASALPQYTLQATEVSVSGGGEDPIEVELSVECGLIIEEQGFKKKKQKGRTFEMTTILTVTSDLDFVDFRRIATKALKETKIFSVVAELSKPSQTVCVYVASENIAGVMVSYTHKPTINHRRFPTMDTRPMTSVEMDLAGLEDDPNFWNMSLEEDGDATVPVKDLTGPRSPGAAIGERSSAQKSKSKVSRGVAEAERLQNGNYKCHHTCKDRTICKHLCCREGTAKLHAGSKAVSKHSGVVSSKSKTKSEADRVAPPVASAVRDSQAAGAKKVKKPAPRIDPAFKRMEELHANTNVRQSLGLSDGQRLTLGNRASSYESDSFKKAVPNFDIELSDIRDRSTATAVPKELEDDSDDLPDVSDLLREAAGRTSATKKSSSSSTTRYSDSEIDDLIREYREDEALGSKEVLRDAGSPLKLPHDSGMGADEWTRQPTSLPVSTPRKRSRNEDLGAQISQKRSRVSVASKSETSHGSNVRKGFVKMSSPLPGATEPTSPEISVLQSSDGNANGGRLESEETSTDNWDADDILDAALVDFSPSPMALTDTTDARSPDPAFTAFGGTAHSHGATKIKKSAGQGTPAKAGATFAASAHSASPAAVVRATVVHLSPVTRTDAEEERGQERASVDASEPVERAFLDEFEEWLNGGGVDIVD